MPYSPARKSLSKGAQYSLNSPKNEKNKPINLAGKMKSGLNVRAIVTKATKYGKIVMIKDIGLSNKLGNLGPIFLRMADISLTRDIKDCIGFGKMLIKFADITFSTIE